ncbi:MAG TPA: DUF104 domain-containing protein [Candidatus Desulfofervidus auxilii]|uniref:DUF104 domain-containing protein n=1 Tax=Desulfofervidus auxilii TaxID=1621989 RepID=A0A7C2A3A0_DESA2|nr:DUF104 domain-containing protein [Candidatus Desulfofervidus auxilii]
MWRRDPKFPRLEKIDLQEGETVEIEIKEKKPQKVISLRGIWKGIEISLYTSRIWTK